MQVFEVIQPGFIPANQAGKKDEKMFRMLLLVEQSFYDSNLAMHLFSASMARFVGHMRSANPQADLDGIPGRFSIRVPNMHARSFLYAVDMFYASVKVISNLPDAPSGVQTILSDFQTAFPKLRDIRNSAHHLEDRIRGLNQNGKPIVLEPEAGSDSFKGGLQLDVLSGEKYGSTLADGSYGEVEVSTASMIALQSLYQRLLNGVRWTYPA